MIPEKKVGDGTSAVGSVSPFPALQALSEKGPTPQPASPLDQLADGLMLIAQGLKGMSRQGFGIAGVSQVQHQLEETVAGARKLLEMDEKLKVKVMKMINRGLRRYEKLYRNSGHDVTRNPEYKVFREGIISEALKTYERGMDYFGFVLGDDVFGTGIGTSPLAVLGELKQKVKIVELDWKATLTEALESNDTSVVQSYGFWTEDAIEPEELLTETSGIEITERGIVTQESIEHMLYILDFCTRTPLKGAQETSGPEYLDYPNASLWTLCPIPTPKMKKLLGGEFVAKFRMTSGADGNKVEVQLTYADMADKHHSHRRMIRVDLPVK